MVGQTPKAEVLGDLGPPGRIDRNGQGESWIYRVEDQDTRGRQIETGAQVISAAVGAFVPFGGLVGTGVGLASKGVAGSEKEPAITTLTVDFGAQGIVRECTITTNFVPADAASGPNAASLPPVDCRRPLAAAPR